MLTTADLSLRIRKKTGASFRQGNPVVFDIRQKKLLRDSPTPKLDFGVSDSRRFMHPFGPLNLVRCLNLLLCLIVASTRKTGGSTGGYKPLLLKASVSRRWLSLCSSHCAFHTSRIPKGISPITSPWT